MGCIKFEEIKVKGVKKWKENGKTRQKTRVFSETVNPFNVDENGKQRSRQDIFNGLIKQRDEWLSKEEK